MASKYRNIPNQNSKKPILDQTKSSTSKDEKLNKADIVSRRTEDIQGPAIGIYDVDESFRDFLRDDVHPQILEDGQLVDVKVLYADAEKWNNAQRNGFLSDNKGKVMTPLILFKRSNIEKDGNLSKLKAYQESTKAPYTWVKKYSRRNRYDAFSVLNNTDPVNEYYVVNPPDYVNLTYDVTIWTETNEHLNRIVESIIFYQGKAGGRRYKFHVHSDAYTFETVNAQGEDRFVKATTSFRVQAYLLPRNITNEENIRKRFSLSTVVWDTNMTGEYLVPQSSSLSQL